MYDLDISDINLTVQPWAWLMLEQVFFFPFNDEHEP